MGDTPTAEPMTPDAAASRQDQELGQEQGTDLEARIAELEQQRGEAIARFQRTLAEFQNFQKRSAREKQDAARNGVARFVRSVLPVVDNLQRALNVAVTSDDGKQLHAGVQMVLTHLESTLRQEGIQPTGQVGDMFDPLFHQALQQVPSDQPAMSIVTVVEPGYVMDGQTVRAAKVIVSAGPPLPSTTQGPEETNSAQCAG